MSGDKQVNGKANGQDDVDMNDTSGSKKPANGGGKDGDDEMTVVVPPSKKSKSSSAGKGAQDDEAKEEPPVDPKEKAINGMFTFPHALDAFTNSPQ